MHKVGFLTMIFARPFLLFLFLVVTSTSSSHANEFCADKGNTDDFFPCMDRNNQRSELARRGAEQMRQSIENEQRRQQEAIRAQRAEQARRQELAQQKAAAEEAKRQQREQHRKEKAFYNALGAIAGAAASSGGSGSRSSYNNLYIERDRGNSGCGPGGCQ